VVSFNNSHQINYIYSRGRTLRAILNAFGIIAQDKGSYAEGMNMFSAEAERGWFELNTAFNYTGTKGQTSTACSTSKQPGTADGGCCTGI
jgi:hypothetical protein